MALGDGADDARLYAAWQVFCTQLEQAGRAIFKDENPHDGMCRVDALRFLTQNLGQAFDLALETRDARYPQLHPLCLPTRKLGSDCADFIYQQAWIDGEHEYVVRGNVGSVRFLNFTVQAELTDKNATGTLHEPFCDVPEVNLFGHQLITDNNGDFELYIGGPERSNNWLPSTSRTRKLFVRQGFDRWDENPATLYIEKVGEFSSKPLPTVDSFLEAIDWAGGFLLGTMADWPDFPYQHSPFVDPSRPNCFPEPPDWEEDADRKRGRTVAHMCWSLPADEALIIQFDAHDGFWNITNMGVFFNSMDFRSRPVSYTPSRVAIDGDGKLRLVLAHRDPGVHNWIDTQGFTQGNLTYRNLLGNQATRFSTRVIKHSKLGESLPPDTTFVSAEQRQAQLQERFRAIQRRYGIFG